MPQGQRRVGSLSSEGLCMIWLPPLEGARRKCAGEKGGKGLVWCQSQMSKNYSLTFLVFDYVAC